MKTPPPALLLLLVFTACRPKTDTDRPRYRVLTESVYASGNVQPDREYTLHALADGYLAHGGATPGDTVAAGQVLFHLEADQQDIRVGNARTGYQTARANAAAQSPVLAETEAAVQSARARMQQDSVNFVRYQNLWAQNATARIAYDRVALSYQTACNDYHALQNRLRRTRTQLRADLDNARSQYALSTAERGNYRLASRISGRVYQVYKEPGELVRRGEAVALLGDPHGLYLRLNVDELDIQKIHPGQQILVTLDSYPDTVWQATVTTVHPMLNPRDRTFRVDAHFSKAPPTRHAGLTAEANIVVRQKARALAVPRAFLIGKDSLRVLQDGRKRTVRIRRGVENMEYVEVLQGVDTATVLVR